MVYIHVHTVSTYVGCKYGIYSIKRSGRLFNFWTFRVGTFSRWALIQGWALIKFSPVSAIKSLFCNKTINKKKT